MQTYSSALNQCEIKERENLILQEDIYHPEPHILMPYLSHFSQRSADELENYANFSRFQKQCLLNEFLLHQGGLLSLRCRIEQNGSEARVSITFTNHSKNSNLGISCLYKIPKCFSIQKYSNIQKKFVLKDALTHEFGIKSREFPVESCLLSLQYEEINSQGSRHRVDTSLPLTIRNYTQFLAISEGKWMQEWDECTQGGRSFCQQRNVLLEKNTITADEIAAVLQGDFLSPGSMEGVTMSLSSIPSISTGRWPACPSSTTSSSTCAARYARTT